MKHICIVLLILFIFLCSTLMGIDDKFVRLIYQSKTPIANNIKVLDQYVYINNDWNLYIYSVKNIWNPILETAFSSSFPITDVLNLDYNHIFICSHEPTNEITEIDSLNLYGRIYFIQSLTCNKARREGPLLYTTHRDNGMEISDISKGVMPQKLSSFSEKWGIIDLEAKYPVVHALNDFGYVNIDVSDLAYPKTNGYNYEIVDGTVLCVNRNIVWVGAGSTLLAIEVTYPDKPVIINRYRFSSEINDIKAKGDELFVALKTTGLRILDISNTKFIVEKNSFYLKTGINSIAIDGDNIYLGAGNQGWYLIEYR